MLGKHPRPTSLVVAINRFRLPKTREWDPNQLGSEPAEFGIQLGSCDDWPTKRDTEVLPIKEPTLLLYNYYHYMPLLRDFHGELSGRLIQEPKRWVGSFDCQNLVDLTAIWAMATIYLELGKQTFASLPEMRKYLGELDAAEVQLAEPFGISPAWRITKTDRTYLYLVIPRMSKRDYFSRDKSLAMAHYALLAILEWKYNEKAKEQLGQPDENTGEATKRILSAASLFHQRRI